MRRRSATQQQQNGDLTTADNHLNGPICDGNLKIEQLNDNNKIEADNKSAKKVNGTPRSTKKLKKDVKDMVLKDRLKALNESKEPPQKENVVEEEKLLSLKDDVTIVADVRESTMQQLGDNASTSKSDEAPNDDPLMDDKSRGESLAVLLSQGLTSGDAEKIDSVLTRTNPQTISATLRELPITQIVPLLKQIEWRFRNRKTLDTRCWVRWVQYTISIHAPYLSTIGSLESELGTLYSWMRNRSAHIASLYNLHGKLTLLLEQIERRANPKFFIYQQPTLLFNEEDAQLGSEHSESSEEFEENESVSSDEDWWEDEDIASEGSEASADGQQETSDEDSSAEEDDEEEENDDEEDGEEALQSADKQEGSDADEMDVD